ncbi:T7SS effector LXG polymorphic toxin [Listeria fleischmannii]|uniref:LXG domain-containing protein n=1 Tax=Listeria fleischmannii TaxID=1069827 RepID=A0A841YHI9_9LIST|nr:T7SS effector LXG polymorphic toxin [Listeria fleischmannii]EIA19123.1 hypothetical protein KKC_14125 [Listeria fleischmannii subsp. coloradonensis]MBC1399801.1 hypothetical protein [Listeria fleischmannii]MBC1428110.1 hypothetical protein [Listeria fleischmannii]STY35003.1 Bacillus transposase protein [Listeria fleischmannii subsp. coloradonensis]
MSVDMYLSQSDSQATSSSAMCQQQIQGYEELQKAISSFTLTTPFLRGAAYDSAKAYFSAVLFPLAQGGLLLTEAVGHAVKKFPETYRSQVDSKDLKEEELKEQIRQADLLIQQAEELKSASTSLEVPDLVKDLQFFQKNQSLINTHQSVKKDLEEKLAKLMAFHASSPSIFSEIASLKQAVDQGLAQTKTAWNSSTGTFNISNDLAWAKQINKLYMDKKMKAILDKIPELNQEDLRTILEFANNHPDDEVPASLINYLKENKDDIISDIKNDALSNFVEQLGVGITKFSGIINVLEGIKGPAGGNSFVMVNPNGVGSQMMKYGNNISTVGKTLGYGFIVAGFGIGMYDDMSNKGKTVGQAISHNTVSTGIGVGSGILGTVGVGLLVSNPGGWAVLGGIAVGTIVSVGFDYLYDNNILHIQDGLDWAGDKIDSGIDWASDKIDEGISWTKDRIKDAGQAISHIGESINPMNWAW